MARSSRRRVSRWTTLALAAAGLLAAAGSARAQVLRTGPSSLCHVTDGSFTACSSPSGREWSDIDFLTFNGARVYTDQGHSPANLYLMYDLLGRNAPLGPQESFDVRFDVVEDGQLEHYLVQIFGSGATAIFVDGVPAPSPEGIAGAVGFGPSPGRPGFFDAFVELAVPLGVVYSPDIPLFWSTSAPSRDCQTSPGGCCKPGEPGCPGLAAAASVPVSATIVSANSDGTTTVAQVPLNATPADFCSAGQGVLADLIDALLPPGGAYRNHGDYVSRVVHKTQQALASLVNSQVLASAEAGAVESCVVAPRAASGAGKP